MIDLHKHRFDKRIIILTILMLTSVLFSNLGPAHAAGPYSANVITNPGFENVQAPNLPAGWITEFIDSNAGSTITVNSTTALLGNYAARLDVSQDTHSATTGQVITFGHQTLRQQLPTNLFFSNMTSRPDSFSIWFNIQPKFVGYSGFDVRIKAFDTTEMDYIFYNPATGISASNSSTGGEAGKPVKYFIIPTPTMNHWTHLTRNLAQDWLAQMTGPSGTPLPGTFTLAQALDKIEIWSFYYLDTNTQGVYGETEWVDNIAIYIDSAIPPPPPPPSNYYAAFNFLDTTGTSVNNIVKWKLFNSTGQEIINYNQNSPTLILEPYTVAVYYPVLTGQNPEPYLIRQQRITLNTTYPVSLEMFPQNTFPWNYIAINNTITSMQVIKENATFLRFYSQGGSGPSLILVKVQSKPVAVQRNMDDPSSIKWSYDSSLSMLRIPAIALGNFSIFVNPPLTIPRIAFQDFQGNSVATGLTWRILNPDGTLARVVPGQLVENGTYTFQAFYYDYLIYTSTLTSTPNPVRLQMLPIGNQQKNYVAFSSAVTSITILENSPDGLQFKATGQGPNLIIVNSPNKPLNIQLDGNTITSWTYNSTTSTIAIQASQLGTFTITYANATTIPLYFEVIIIGAIAIATVSLVVWQWIRSRTSTESPPEKPVTKEQSKSKPNNPQKGQRGRS
ncbi:MAG TPA: hypothetical protein VGS11_06675 [Candidatus Bathyarchaeia archaeon]|nr:hypothetical protein [Candidatus Bathyarchaeia archaeon]